MNTQILLFTDTGDMTFTYRPGGVYKVASVLRKLGYKVVVNHLCTFLTKKGWEEVVKKYKTKHLIWVGISTTFLTFNEESWTEWKEEFENSKKPFIKPKKYHPFKLNSEQKNKEKFVYNQEELEYFASIFQVPIVVGGSQLTRNSRIDDLQSKNKNIIFVPGYSEDILEKITNDIETTNHWADTRKNVYSFDREKFRKEKYIWTKDDLIDQLDHLPLEINRGCAFRCGYCTYDHIGQTNHYKFPETLHSEIQENYDTLGVTSYSVLDDLYNDSNQKVQDLYSNVFSKLSFDIEWTAYVRLDLLWRYPEQIEILQKSGLRACSFGIETLNDQAGKLVGKGLGRERILSTLKSVSSKWKKDVLSYGLFIAGLPYEPMNSWQETVDIMDKNKFTHADSWNFLYINTNKNNIHKSQLDLDPEKYGYSFNEQGWTHESGFNETDAKQFSSDYREKHTPHVGSHFSYDYFKSAGYTHKQIANNDVTYNNQNDEILKKSLYKRLKFNKKFIF